jgi:hypothetical protein
MIVLVTFTGPEKQQIDVNPEQVVSLRNRRDDGGYYHPAVRCIIHTADNKFIAVTEDCEAVRRKLEGKQR